MGTHQHALHQTRSSRLAGFYQRTLEERAALVAEWAGLTDEEVQTLQGALGLDLARADQMIENVVGRYALPLGIAVNFVVNGRAVLVPMVIEEPSVVAGASFAAKLASAGGGFRASATAPEMIGQLQVIDLADPWSARYDLLAARDELLALANEADPVLVRLGGGARDLEVRVLGQTAVGPMLAVHLIYDCRDAMGANSINSACETLAPRVEAITGGRVLLRILSNLADHRLARARCTVPPAALAFGDFSGEQVAQGIVEAWAFADADPYRAATHNKGIMNGVDAVVMATGNDWRAVEAGAHAYAARSGRYTSLSTWARDGAGNLVGTLELPLALGIVGGATRVHPVAQVALRILGVQSAGELAEVVAAAGLAQNLAALRALATEGIQRGHMRLHARQVAIAAGAREDEVAALAARLVAEHAIRVDRAEQILSEMRGDPQPAQLGR
ncbi:MAG: hydroxymethylglutaryl-CoA reductase, degradative [Anaerolineales bacterium]|nr:hydroxymethylglutaryl-CoA reductase, degradative [Anaerolineales bacterium]